MSVKITYFVHGTTTDNEHHLATGWAHGELSELGIQQAKDLGSMVADKQFDVIFCSDLKRAVDSSELALDVLLRGRTWQKAIDENWRKTKSWQPGWEYEY